MRVHITGNDPKAFAELIASTLHGHVVVDPTTNLALAGTLARTEQTRAEQRRASQEIDTVDFKLIDDDNDWSDL